MRIALFVLLSAICSGVFAADGVIYRSKDCSCCERWAEHMEAAGFELKDRRSTNIELI